MLDRPSYYLRRFVKDGHPKALPEREHQALADYFGLTSRELGIRDLWEARTDD